MLNSFAFLTAFVAAQQLSELHVKGCTKDLCWDGRGRDFKDCSCRPCTNTCPNGEKPVKDRCSCPEPEYDCTMVMKCKGGFIADKATCSCLPDPTQTEPICDACPPGWIESDKQICECFEPTVVLPEPMPVAVCAIYCWEGFYFTPPCKCLPVCKNTCTADTFLNKENCACIEIKPFELEPVPLPTPQIVCDPCAPGLINGEKMCSCIALPTC